MLHFLAHIAKVLWRERIALFWPIWLAITAFGVSLLLWVIPREKKAPEDHPEPPHRGWSRGSVLSIVLLSVFLICYIAGCLVWEDFAYSDNTIFTLSSLAGRDYPPPIWPDEGRFFPLSHQEFNVLAHVTHSATGFHTFRVIQLLVVCVFLLLLDDQLSLGGRVGLITLLLITPSIWISFSGLIYPEANVLFWLVGLIWSVKHFEGNHAFRAGAAAIISAQCMLYYKETAFLLVVGFAAGRLVLRCRTEDGSGWDFKKLWVPESRLDFCLVFLVAIFSLYYLAAMFPNYSMGYADLNRLPLTEIIAAYLKLDLLVWVLIVVVSVRTIMILRGKLAPMLLWDGLGLAAIGCVVGYLVLRMEAGYYLAPADLIAVLYLGRLLILSFPKMGSVARLATATLLILILVQDLALTSFRMYERKNLIHAKSEIGRLVKARYQSDPLNPGRLFFPYANTHRIKEFGAYLSYLGIPVEGVPRDSNNEPGILLIVKEAKVEGSCEGPGTPVCRTGNSPNSGDLVIFLPDDFSRTGSSDFDRGQESEPLLSYEPFPPVPSWLRPYEKRLGVVSPVYPHPLPDHWLSAKVILWK